LIPVREKRHSVLTHPNKLLKKHTKLSQRLQEMRKKKKNLSQNLLEKNKNLASWDYLDKDKDLNQITASQETMMMIKKAISVNMIRKRMIDPIDAVKIIKMEDMITSSIKVTEEKNASVKILISIQTQTLDYITKMIPNSMKL